MPSTFECRQDRSNAGVVLYAYSAPGALKKTSEPETANDAGEPGREARHLTDPLAGSSASREESGVPIATNRVSSPGTTAVTGSASSVCLQASVPSARQTRICRPLVATA